MTIPIARRAFGALAAMLLLPCLGLSSVAAQTPADPPATDVPTGSPAPVESVPVESVPVESAPVESATGASPRAIASARAIGRGINFGNMFEPPREGDWGLRYSDELVDKAWEAGFRTVRLPVRWSNHAAVEAPFKISPVFMRRIESVVEALLARGFRVVLNMHHYRQLDGDPLDAHELAVDEAVLEPRFLALWAQIANRFRHQDDRLIFELYNEPHGRLDGEPWNVLAASALSVVRQTNPERVVVIGPTHWNNASNLALLKMPDDPNLIATIHHYEPFKFTHQGAEWVKPTLPTGVRCCDESQRAEILGPLETAKAWSERTGYPVFIGEFGAYSKAHKASRLEFTRSLRREADARGMSWVYWEFASSFGVYDPAAKRFDRQLLETLIERE